MNKWIKHGMVGFVIGGTAMTSGSAEKVDLIPSENTAWRAVSFDVQDVAGGSKLKDRMLASQEDGLLMVYALLNS